MEWNDITESRGETMGSLWRREMEREREREREGEGVGEEKGRESD